jgi:hypothetical protein
MPDQLSREFEHEVLEADIKALAQEIGRQREKPESGAMSEQELLKQAIRGLPPLGAQAEPPAPPKQSSSASPLPDYAQSASPEVRLEIEYLVDFAFHQGIAKADAEARKSSDFILDAFHDALSRGKLYTELKKRGILK